MLQKIIILGTGGTIAGLSSASDRPGQYRSAQLPVADLTLALDSAKYWPDAELVVEQVAQIDSKDMDEIIWRRLLGRVVHWLAQADVMGLVITHGTDTVEETGFFLSALLKTELPVVLTCAMRPADAVDADGPQNLHDAIALVYRQAVSGVCLVCAGRVLAGHQIQKVRGDQVDAFDSAPFPPMGFISNGLFEGTANALSADGIWPDVQQVLQAASWPVVCVLLSHAMPDPRYLQWLCGADAGIDGIVVATTGSGTVHQLIEQQLLAAPSLAIWRATRCAFSRLNATQADRLPWPKKNLTPVQARIALMLNLLATETASAKAD